MASALRDGDLDSGQLTWAWRAITSTYSNHKGPNQKISVEIIEDHQWDYINRLCTGYTRERRKVKKTNVFNVEMRKERYYIITGTHHR